MRTLSPLAAVAITAGLLASACASVLDLQDVPDVDASATAGDAGSGDGAAADATTSRDGQVADGAADGSPVDGSGDDGGGGDDDDAASPPMDGSLGGDGGFPFSTDVPLAMGVNVTGDGGVALSTTGACMAVMSTTGLDLFDLAGDASTENPTYLPYTGETNPVFLGTTSVYADTPSNVTSFKVTPMGCTSPGTPSPATPADGGTFSALAVTSSFLLVGGLRQGSGEIFKVDPTDGGTVAMAALAGTSTAPVALSSDLVGDVIAAVASGELFITTIAGLNSGSVTPSGALSSVLTAAVGPDGGSIFALSGSNASYKLVELLNSSGVFAQRTIGVFQGKDAPRLATSDLGLVLSQGDDAHTLVWFPIDPVTNHLTGSASTGQADFPVSSLAVSRNAAYLALRGASAIQVRRYAP